MDDEIRLASGDRLPLQPQVFTFLFRQNFFEQCTSFTAIQTFGSLRASNTDVSHSSNNAMSIEWTSLRLP